MTGRALALEIGLTLVLAYVFNAVIQLLLGIPTVDAFFTSGPGLFVLTMGIAIAVWLAMRIGGWARNRQRASRRWSNVLAALMGIVIDVAIVTAYSIVTGGYALFFAVYAIEASICLLLGAAVATGIVHGITGERKPQRELPAQP